MDVDVPVAALAGTGSDDAAQPSHVDLLMEGLEELRPELEPLAKNALSKVASKLYYKYRIKEYRSSAEILLYYARELLERLDEQVWGGSGFWEKLQEAAGEPRITLQHIEYDQIPSNLIRRKTLAVPRVHKKPGEEGGNLPQGMETPQHRRIGRPAGKMSALRLVGSKGSKRRFDSDDDTPDTVSRGSKVVKRSHEHDSDDDDDMDAASSSPESDGSEPDTAESPAALKVVVRAENIPTSEPKGPNGTWVCEEDDCGFVVRNPEQEDGRERIREHMQEAHYEDDENRDNRINLAVTEGVKNHLPIEYFSPSPSPHHFRYSCLSNDHPEVSPFWDSGPSGPANVHDASSPRSVTVAESSDEDDVPPDTSGLISQSLLSHRS